MPIPTLCRAVALAPLLLSLAAPGAAAQTVPEGTMIEAWRITCEGGPCRAFFNIENAGRVVLTWSLLRDRAADQVTAIITVPTGVALPPGLRVELGDGRHVDGAFQVCEPDGCTAILLLDAEAQTALGARQTTRVLFVPYGAEAPVAFEVPVAGFAQATEAL